jgi:hypothetical protein
MDEMDDLDVVGWDVVAVNDILDIREQLAKRFKLEPPDPDYVTRCRPGP